MKLKNNALDLLRLDLDLLRLLRQLSDDSSLLLATSTPDKHALTRIEANQMNLRIKSEYASDLRLHGHPFQLHVYDTDLHKKSFIVRTLYELYYTK